MIVFAATLTAILWTVAFAAIPVGAFYEGR